MTMKTRTLIVAAVAVAVGCATSHPRVEISGGPAPAGAFVAYSLREAANVLRGRAPASDVRSVAGMTALAGIVYDSAGRDLILVGQVRPELQPITADHIA